MHSSLVRVQNVFGFFTTVVFSVGILIALSVVVSPQKPSAKLEMKSVQVVKGRPHYYSSKKEEYAHIKFDLEADLSTLFSWNTKQVFVYITASFPPSTNAAPPTASHPYSEAIIWDAIIPSSSLPSHPNTYIHPHSTTSKTSTGQKVRPASKLRGTAASSADAKPYPLGTTEGILRLSGQKPKYQITTPRGRVAELGNATLTLHYNVQPWVGALVWSSPAPRMWGVWKGLQGWRSRAFDFPPLKAVGASRSKEDLGTATGAEANRGSPA